jgi:hypothetical protein
MPLLPLVASARGHLLNVLSGQASKAIDIGQACDYSARVARRRTAELDAQAVLARETPAKAVRTSH